MIKKNVERDLSSLKRTLTKIRQLDFSGLKDEELKNLWETLKNRVQNGEPLQAVLPQAFALVDEAVARAMGLSAFDVQLMAASALAAGNIIEMPTGEGKTLIAVFAACLNTLPGKGVHILTFNDYLARRDALWMEPIYAMLGISVQYIEESMGIKERRKAYRADVTYLTAKEAGFDYLRGFLVYSVNDLVQRPFYCAIIDEADSILIDEARVPLVLAGDVPTQVNLEEPVYHAVSCLLKDKHFATDEYSNNIYLTEEGSGFLEDKLGLKNLYDPANLETLSMANIILQALHLLKKDVDYIVRNGHILLVDEFTGRVMKDRQWPDGLQAAVEIKEGLAAKPQGMVMDRITLQNFLQLYPNLSGMTGTACSAAPEFDAFYEKTVVVIPSHSPCARIDQEDILLTHKEAKEDAIVSEIIRVHSTGRPILLGTASVEESERLAGALRPFIPDIAVLNAKNDTKEAEIIANAGSLFAVTISTNMAGRGVDIRLGGKNQEDSKKVCALGGLYVIGSNRFESIRVDNQLRGRAGRQGDPGESCFFISLEDDLLVKYHLSDCLPSRLSALRQTAPLQEHAINRAVRHIQKVAEGQIFDAKITLSKYSQVAEDQRKIVHKKRQKLLFDEEVLAVLEKSEPQRAQELLLELGEQEYRHVQKTVELFSLNQCWIDYLLVAEAAMDEVQVIGKAKGDPVMTYNQKLIEAFDRLETHIQDTILEIYRKLPVKNGKVDLAAVGVCGPSSTRTYLVNDGTESWHPMGEIANAMSAPLYSLYLLADSIKKKKK